MLQKVTMETALNFPINDYNWLVVSWWGTDSYFNNELIQIGDIEIMTSEYGSSGSFGSMLRSKYIGYNTHISRGIKFSSKTIPIHGPFHKSDLNYSYSRSHFSRLPQEVAKKLIYCLSCKVSYASNVIDLVINGFSTNDVSSFFHICDHSIVKFGIREKCLGFSNTYHNENLDRFIRSIVD